MNKTIDESFDRVQRELSKLRISVADVQDFEETEDIVRILAKLKEMDVGYQSFCAEQDEEYELELGSTYHDVIGPNVGFYIEADDWHEVSRLLRKI